MTINIKQVFTDLQNFIRDYKDEPILEMPVGISISMSGNLMVKYTTEKRVPVGNIEQAAEVINEWLIKMRKN